MMPRRKRQRLWHRVDVPCAASGDDVDGSSVLSRGHGEHVVRVLID